MKNFKRLYIDFCNSREDVPVFLHPSWMEFTCGEDWNVALTIHPQSGDIEVVLVFQISRKAGYSRLITPMNTPWSGLWFPTSDLPLKSRQRIIQQLIGQVPPSAYALLKLQGGLEEALPFHWAGYELLTRLTMRLDLQRTDVRTCYSKSLQKVLKKPCPFSIQEIGYDEYAQSYSQHSNASRVPVWTEDQGKKLMSWLSSIGCHPILLGAFDGTQLISAVFVLVADEIAYYLLSFTHEAYRSHELNTHLLDESIHRAKMLGCRTFDFEGSMIEGIYKYMRRFGGSHHEIVTVRNYGSRLYGLIDRWRTF